MNGKLILELNKKMSTNKKKLKKIELNVSYWKV